MNKISFSHCYLKFPESRVATLLQVFVVDFKDLTEAFKKYDTEYWKQASGESPTTLERYPLPEGKLLVLLLQAEKLFTTIRRWTPQKEKYYKSQEGLQFKIEVEGE